MTKLSFVIASLALCGGFSSIELKAQDSAPKLVSRTAGGVPWKNAAELKAAATAGNPQACAQLGDHLLRGDGMPKDGAQALVLLEKAARAGIASAAFRLGMLLDDGVEVAQDRPRALAYFRAAAAGDAAEAYHNIGAAYASAHGVKRDFTEALAWLILAKKHGAGADSEKAVRERILKSQHPEWISAGENRAAEIARELAAAPPASFLPPPEPLVYGGPSTPSSVGDSAASPINLVSPTGRPLYWASFDVLQRAAEAGDSAALAALGQVLIEGKQAPEDVARAIPLLERGAKAGSIDAAQQLADLYTKGGKTAPDATKAFQYNLQAARGGAIQAMYNTGALLSNGLGAPRDFVEALAWLMVAKQNGLDPGSEKRIHDYLAKTAPEQIAVAENRAADLQRAIAAAQAAVR